jgi:hypothetical protein
MYFENNDKWYFVSKIALTYYEKEIVIVQFLRPLEQFI